MKVGHPVLIDPLYYWIAVKVRNKSSIRCFCWLFGFIQGCPNYGPRADLRCVGPQPGHRGQISVVRSLCRALLIERVWTEFCCDVPSKKDKDLFIVILSMKHEKKNLHGLQNSVKKSLPVFLLQPFLLKFWSPILR